MKTNATKKPTSLTPAKKTTPVEKPAQKPIEKPAKAAPKKRAVKAVAPSPITTTISAQIDIGFGNALYIRGEGPGLSWDRGTLMECVADDLWRITLPESARPTVFKFLVNDLSWNAGVDNYSAIPGATVTIVPTF